jgi:heptose-I-phosphate ethanolaminephosphotransferase
MRYFLQALSLFILLYFISAAWGCTHLLKWRGLRIGVLGTIFLTAAECFTDTQILSISFLPALLFLLLWTIPLSYIRGHISISEEKDFSRMKKECVVGISGASILFVLSTYPWNTLIYITISVLSSIAIIISWSIAAFQFTYFLIYRNIFQMEDMVPIVLTDVKEASSFVRTQVGNGKLLAIVCTSLFLLFITIQAIQMRGYASEVSYDLYDMVAFCFMAGGILYYYGRKCFPFQEYRWAKENLQNKEHLMELHEKNLQCFHITKPDTIPQTVILIIGESANKNHMRAFNFTYPWDTTPWESSVINNRNFYFFPHAYSNYTQTEEVLGQLLSGIDQYGRSSLDNFISIFDVAKAAGMDTWWISNHSKADGQGSMTSIIADNTDHQCWTSSPKGYDGNLLPLLAQVPDQGNHFIAVHLMGSHLRYEDRFPRNYCPFSQMEVSDKINFYDMSIYYTDSIIKQIYLLAVNKFHAGAVIYVSDHGEDMKYTHGVGHFTYDMTRIPLWIYLSDDYKLKHPDVAQNLDSNKKQIFTNDLLFDTISGLLGCYHSLYQEKYDLSGGNYHLLSQTAVTMHGKVKISDDPDLTQ